MRGAPKAGKAGKMGKIGKNMNRTGSAMRAEDSMALDQVTRSTPASSPGDARLVSAVRNAYSMEGELLGHLPKSGASAVRGKKAGLAGMLVDKMGERLAFERTGVRLYEALLTKMDAEAPIGPGANAPKRADVERICREEHEHFLMMKEVIEEMGGDPTAMTPAANVAANLSSGLPKVMLDPRSTFAQCLDAILIAELADNDGWMLLIDLAEANGKDELVERFRQAYANEEEHLELVRAWIREATLAGEPAKALA